MPEGVEAGPELLQARLGDRPEELEPQGVRGERPKGPVVGAAADERLEPDVQIRRIESLLARKGFGYSTISRVMRELDLLN